MRMMIPLYALLLPVAALAQTATPALTPAPAPTPPAAPATYGAPISLAEARTLVDRAVEESKTRGFRMAIAVVEPSGELVAFARMDDVQYGSIRLAQQKAQTAARFRQSTADVEERVMGGRIVLLSSDSFLAIAGGVPIISDGKIIGALGISGAKASEDHAVATAALTAK